MTSLFPLTTRWTLCLLVLILSLSLMTSCSPKKTPRPEPAPPDTSPADAGRRTGGMDTGAQDTAAREIEADITAEALTARNRFLNEDIYFNYDSAELSAAARNILRAKAGWLQDHPDPRIIIEGHCDERGTSEYNLALGEQRAMSAKKYLISLGISPARMQTISYGEERPAVMGTGESVWSKNRRAHFAIP